jgi:hypothetical protein
MSLSLVLVLEAVWAILTLILFLGLVDAVAFSIASMNKIVAGGESLTVNLRDCQTSSASLDNIHTQGSLES